MRRWSTVDPGLLFGASTRTKRVGRRSASYLDTVTEHAAAPVIAKYTGVLGGADIEVYTRTTTFAIMQSIRLDRGPAARSIPNGPAAARSPPRVGGIAC